MAIAETGDRTIVWFEDRRSLDAATGLGRVARVTARSLPTTKQVEFVPLSERWPLLGMSVSAEGLAQFFNHAMPAQEFGAALRFDDAPPDPPDALANSSLWRPEVAIPPGYFFSDHFVGYLNPTLQAQVAQGWHALGRLNIELYPTVTPSPGFLLLGGHRPLGPGLDAAWNIGRWDEARYGADGELAGLWGDGAWQWKVRAGLVTTTVPSAQASVEYRFPWLDSYVRGGGGFYPAGDRALFLVFGRMFPASTLELGYYRSDFGNQLRASLLTYLGPARRPDPRPMRVELPGWLDEEYRASGAAGASVLYPEIQAGAAWRRLSPVYVRKHVDSWLE